MSRGKGREADPADVNVAGRSRRSRRLGRSALDDLKIQARNGNISLSVIVRARITAVTDSSGRWRH